LIDNGQQQVNIEIDYFIKQRIKQIEKQKKNKLRKDKTLDRKRIVNFDHSGFAFSGTEGQDKLVTDKLTNRLKEGIYRNLMGNIFEQTNNVNHSINLDTTQD